MKSSAWDNKLWHDKMLEIPLEGDVDSAWNKMQGMLNENMPAAPAAPVVKKLWGVSRSLLLTVLYTAAAAAIIILATHYVLKKNFKTIPEHHKQNIKHVSGRHDSARQAEKDSILNNNPAADTVANDSTGNGSTDNNLKPAGAGKNGNAPPVTGNPATGASATGSLPAPNAATRRLPIAPGNLAAKNTKGKPAGKGKWQGNGANQNKKIQTQNTLVQASTTGRTAALTGRNGHVRNPGFIHAGPGISATIPGVNSGHNRRRYPGARNNAGWAPVQQNTVPPFLFSGNRNQSVNQKTLLLAGSSLQVYGLSIANNTNPALLQFTNKLPANSSIFSPGNIGSDKLAPGNSSAGNKPARMKDSRTTRNPNSPGNSNFDLGLEAGINSNQNSTVPYAGVSGAYFITPKLSIGTGINLFSSRIIKGGGSISNYPYTTTGDSGKIIKHVTGKLLITNSQKIYTVDVPITVSYKITNWLSANGGAVISIPTKTNTIVNTLTPITAPFDTTSAYRKLSGSVNSSAISNKTTVNLTGGISLNVSRVYFKAGYVQGLSPYTISSAYGKSNVSYHALQFGIGYKLFKAKPKPNHR
jgi:hypothetical protein